MATEQTMKHCQQCQENTVHLVQKPNHILHFLLSVFTAGLWMIVWLSVSMTKPAPQCTKCGKKNGHESFKLTR